MYGEAAMRMIAKVGEWLDHRLQLAAPIREAAEHPVPRNTASWFYVSAAQRSPSSFCNLSPAFCWP
jgi:hypothetical protein